MSYIPLPAGRTRRSIANKLMAFTCSQMVQSDCPRGPGRTTLAFMVSATSDKRSLEGLWPMKLPTWTQRLMEKMNEPALPENKPISFDQVLNADRALWVKVADATRSNLVGDPLATKPFGAAFERLSDHPEILCYIAPMPGSFQRPQHDSSTSVQKGTGKSIESRAKAKSKFLQVVQSSWMMANSCASSIRWDAAKQRLSHHLCWKTSCRKPHPGNECGSN